MLTHRGVPAAPLTYKGGGWERLLDPEARRVHVLRTRALDARLGLGHASEDRKGQRWLITRCPAPRWATESSPPHS